MERKMEAFLREWKKSSSRMPLIVHGARQIGKTYTILEFGKKQYTHVAYANFESNKQLCDIFELDLDPERIVKEMSVLLGIPIIDNQTLLFFDEIQACERALTALKYFAEDAPQYHIIAAGSLLGVALNREKYSFPVGKVILKTMYPMDFEEFLLAIESKKSVEMIHDCYTENAPCSIHEHFLALFRLYLSLGGMPKVVETYLKTHDFLDVDVIQQAIVDTYIADMAKYATPADTVKLMAAYKSIPAQLAKDNKKFQYKLIKSGARAEQYETTLDWLLSAGIISKCVRVSHGYFPLNMNAENSFFKVYFNDVGLLRNRFGIAPELILTPNESIYHIKGALAENYVANSLISNGFENYYWESSGKAELDFILQTKNGECIPIEVKSANNTRSKSLNQYILKNKPSYSIRVSTKNFGYENQIKSIPLYAVWCIKD